jgi:S1-C subfamily serine protease
MVVGVLPRGPAQQAGIRPFARGADGRLVAGDVILAFNGKAVENFDDLLAQLEQHQPGETVKVTVSRNGARIELPVLLALP